MKARGQPYILYLIKGLLSLGIYRLAKIRMDERRIKREIHKPLGLGNYPLQVFLSYITLFLYSYTRVNCRLAEYRSDFLIINRTPPIITENDYSKKAVLLSILTLGIYLIYLDYRCYKQSFLFNEVREKVRRKRNASNSLSRFEIPEDVTILGKSVKKRKKTHLDMADVEYRKPSYRKKENTSLDDVIYK